MRDPSRAFAALRRKSLIHGVAGIAATLAALGGAESAHAQSKPLGYSITFEANDGTADGWARSGANAALWAHGTPIQGPVPAAHSGTKCYATDLMNPYPDSAEAFLESPVLDLAGGTAPRIQFQHHLDSEAMFDGGCVQVKRGAGAYITLEAADAGFITGAPNSTSVDGLQGADGWTGNPTGTGFQPVIIDLTRLSTAGLSGITATEQVQIRFWFGSDSSVQARGWFIDTFSFADGGAIPIVTFDADTTGATRWNRPDSTGSALATNATNTPFQVQPFIVPPGGTGAYTINADWQGFDGFLFLYRFPFDSAAPLANFVAGNDDYNGTSRSRLDGQNLVAEQRYVVVMTGYSNAAQGPYTVKVEGPVAVRLLPGGVAFQASFEAQNAVGDWPLTVRFTDLSPGEPTEWLWSFGDGVTSTEQSPSHTYRKEGVFDVSLTITKGTRTSTLEQPELVIVIMPELPKRKDMGSSGGCAISAAAATPSGIFGAWAPVALALAGLAAASRRRGRGPGPERPA